jgi:TolA-binding protein
VLRPGQTLTVSLPRAEVVISEGRQAARRDVPAAARSADALSMAAPAATTSSAPGLAAQNTQAPARPAAAGARRWNEAIARGEWDRILADVERTGLDKTVQTLASDELLALADAARYRRRTSLARLALVEHIRRFPSSGRSLDAVFLLGRVEEAAGAKALAIQRYDEYLARAGAGTYAAEALGRRMILTKAVEGPAGAKRAAQEYLRRFPKGTYAAAAHGLQRAP